MKTLKYIIFIYSIAIASASGQIDSLTNPRTLLPLDEENEAVADIVMISKSTADGTIIRWAPTNAQTWQIGNDNGYILERVVGKSKTFEKVTPEKIKPWSEDKWKSRVGDDEKYLTIAAMAIYGDSESSGFVQASRDLQNRHAYTLLAADLDQEAALASGLLYFENDTTDNIYGLYRIYTIDSKTGISSDTATAVIGYMGDEKISPPTLQIEENEGALKLSWSGGGRLRANEKFTGYLIERSSDGIAYLKLREDPFMNVSTALQPNANHTVYIDSIDNGIKYYYRVIGIDAFADLSAPSNVVSGMGKDLTAPTNASKLMITENNNKQLNLSWTWEDGKIDQDLVGFNVYRTLSQEGNYIKINTELLEPSIRIFLDETPDQKRLNYYYIEAIDRAGNNSKSVFNIAQIVDRIPPSPPTALVGEIDSNGLILIEWTPPSDDDIQGYELYFSNNLITGFIKMSGDITSNEFFVDSTTFRTLTEEIHYQVVAVDYNFNRSDASEFLTLKRPDRIPPGASIFTDYIVSEDGIQFSWKASQSSDVISIVLIRREAGKDWEEQKEFDSTKPHFMDRNVEVGVRYEYSLVTKDDDGNESRPFKNLVLEALKPQFLKDITSIDLVERDGKYKLSWNYENAEDFKYNIYKKTKNGLSLYKKIDSATEITVPMDENKTIQYAIKVKGMDGRESKMSELVSFKI